jgi:prevent-host-death family protein
LLKFSVAQAKNNLSKLIDQALKGVRVTIARHGRTVVEVRPSKDDPSADEKPLTAQEWIVRLREMRAPRRGFWRRRRNLHVPNARRRMRRPVIYLDASVLVPLLLEQSGSADAERLILADGHALSDLTCAEGSSAIPIAVRTGRLPV